jgi:dTDP-4-dehydrorhamnose reductase
MKELKVVKDQYTSPTLADVLAAVTLAVALSDHYRDRAANNHPSIQEDTGTWMNLSSF